MGNVKKLNTPQHKYNTKKCAGCDKLISEEYTEIGLPSPDGMEVEHIALCEVCADEARKEGIIN